MAVPDNAFNGGQTTAKPTGVIQPARPRSSPSGTTSGLRDDYFLADLDSAVSAHLVGFRNPVNRDHVKL